MATEKLSASDFDVLGASPFTSTSQIKSEKKGKNKCTDEKHGVSSYVDDQELFPQATYYLSPQLKRPQYRYSIDLLQNIIPEFRRGASAQLNATNDDSNQNSQPINDDCDNNETNEKKSNSDFVNVFPSVQKLRLGSEDNLTISVNMPLTKDMMAAPNNISTDGDCGDDFVTEKSETPIDDETNNDNRQKSAGKFGTWDGVFVSCLLNIFGVIMFLRLGFVVGQAGLWYACLIIILSSVVTTLTALSMAAIATNGEQRAGGAYYMISRTLGPSFGAAVGVLFSIGMSVAVSMYVIGFCETVVDQVGVITDSNINDIRIYGCILATILLVWVLIGIGWVIKLQLVLMIVLVVAMLSFFIGSFTTDKNPNNTIAGVDGWSDGTLISNMKPHYYDDVDTINYNFFTMFGIFFPACTGIMAGANISGDLKNPSYDIPVGTLWAIFVSTIVYLVLALLCAASVTTDGLVYNYFVMLDVSLWSPLVLMGIYGATVSSALTSLVGGPRILLSVASDDLIPILRFFAKTSANGEPVRAYFFTYVIAIGCILVGDLNVIAPLITQFFLGTYAFISFACYGMSISHSPGWRPAFKYYSSGTALAGGIICIGIMCFIELTYAVIAIALGFLIFLYVYLSKPTVNWGSAFASRAQWKANENVLGLQRFQTHVKNFQPSFLVMTPIANSEKIDHSLIRFVQSLQRGFGTIVYGDVRMGIFEEHISALSHRTAYLPEYMKINAFHEIVIAENIRSGGRMLLQLSGLGKLRPNTLVLGFRENWNVSVKEAPMNEESRPQRGFSNNDYVGLCVDALRSNMGFMICRGLTSLPFEQTSADGNGLDSIDSIDVWWLLDDGGLSLLVPHILSVSKFWKNLKNSQKQPTIRLFLVRGDDNNDANTATHRQSDPTITEAAAVAPDATTAADADSAAAAPQTSEAYIEPRISGADNDASVMHLHELGRIASQGLVDLSRVQQSDDLWQLEIQQLISKFRLNMSGPFTVRSGRSEPNDVTWFKFAELMGYQWPINDESITNNNKIKRWLRVSELINEHSGNQRIVFATAPFPACFSKNNSNLYLGVCHMLTNDNTRATILLRGTGQNCLTFYSE